MTELIIAALIIGLVLGALARQLVVVLPRVPEIQPDTGDMPGGPAMNTSQASQPFRFKLLHLIPIAGAIVQARAVTDSPQARIWLPAFDLTVMFLVAINFLVVGWTPLFFLSALLIADFTAIMFIDWQYHAIFPLMIYPAIVLALGGSLLEGNIGWPAALVGLLIGTALFMLLFIIARKIYRTNALGFGDVMLAALIGASLGYPRLMAAMIVGSLAGGLIGIVLIILGRLSRKDYIPFGAYLSAATLMYLIFRGAFWESSAFQTLTNILTLGTTVIPAFFQSL